LKWLHGYAAARTVPRMESLACHVCTGRKAAMIQPFFYKHRWKSLI
jgi:hypothetical protein